MKSDKVINLDQDPPPIDGAYMRKLVKQLSTTNSSSKSNDKGGSVVVVDSSKVSQSSRNNSTKQTKVIGSQQQQPQQKKQIRRRPHMIRPYQNKIMNMAEARREIVTALKFHRESMKQATENQQQIQEEKQQKQDERNTSSFEQDGKFDSTGNSISLPPLPPCMNDFSSDDNMIEEFSFSPFSSHNPSLQDCFPNFPLFGSSSSSTSPIDQPLLAENPNFTSLPNHSLGSNSNFNFHNFKNLDDTLSHNNNNNNINSTLFCYSSPISSSSYSPPLSVVTDQEVPSIGTTTTTTSHGEGVSSCSMVDHNNNNNITIESIAATHDVGGGGGSHVHTPMDDDHIKEIESFCQQYQMEWNDTMNSIASTWWFIFMKDLEDDEPEINEPEINEPEIKEPEINEPEIKTQSDAYRVFDEVTEFPSWLNNNADEMCFEQFPEDYFKDPILPSMDIGDIDFEALDEWLS